jgi:hypothetical protein
MPRIDYTRCKDCGEHQSKVGALSHTRLCADCGNRRRNQASLDLANHSGPYFKNWRRGMAASVGTTLLDERPENP